MFSATFLSKRSLARLVKVIVVDFGRPALFLGAGPAVSGLASIIGSSQLHTQKNSRPDCVSRANKFKIGTVDKPLNLINPSHSALLHVMAAR
jgi:hypothetical protein